MLAPIDKMTKRGGNDTIQIIVTTVCDRRWDAPYAGSCSNCTQLLVFRKDYKFMSLACFEEAVLSVKDWPGIVALFGGNPCAHPEFPELCRILSEHIKPEQRGLWTNHTLKHGEVAKATFSKARLNLNAHASPTAASEMNKWFKGRVIPSSIYQPAMHGAILADYRDFGMADSEWIVRRERCDINQLWSGAIAERDGKPYAYFCEVAAALDGIRGQNHGIPAVPGWWREPIFSFESQVKNCCDKGCGVPLRWEGHQDAEETYDISQSWLEQLDNPKVNVEVHQTEPKRSGELTDYMHLRKKP